MLFTKTSSLSQKNLINIDVSENEMHHQHQCLFSSLFSSILFRPWCTLMCFLISLPRCCSWEHFVCCLIRKIGVWFLWQYVTLIYPVATVATVYPLLMTWDALLRENEADFILFLPCERSDSLWVFILSCHYSFYDVAWNLGKIYDNEEEKGRDARHDAKKMREEKRDEEEERERRKEMKRKGEIQRDTKRKVGCQEERVSEERQEKKHKRDKRLLDVRKRNCVTRREWE